MRIERCTKCNSFMAAALTLTCLPRELFITQVLNHLWLRWCRAHRPSAANAGWYGRAKNKKMMRIERRTEGISFMADVLPTGPPASCDEHQANETYQHVDKLANSPANASKSRIPLLPPPRLLERSCGRVYSVVKTRYRTPLPQNIPKTATRRVTSSKDQRARLMRPQSSSCTLQPH
jgi:hypothetical protein